MITTQCTTIDHLIKKTFKESFDFLGDQVNNNTIQHINEHVFRYFFIQHLYQNKTDDIHIEDELKRIDLLLHKDSMQWPIEFKYYKTSYEKPNDKSAPDDNNRTPIPPTAEETGAFENIVESTKLKSVERYCILIASDQYDVTSKNSMLYNNECYPVAELNKKGISVKVMIKKNRIIGNLTLFGWVLKTTSTES